MADDHFPEDPTLKVIVEALSGVVSPEIAERVITHAVAAFGSNPGPYRVSKFVRGPLRTALVGELGARGMGQTLRHVESFADRVLPNGLRGPLYRPPVAQPMHPLGVHEAPTAVGGIRAPTVDAWGVAHNQAWGVAHNHAWGVAHNHAWGVAHNHAWGEAQRGPQSPQSVPSAQTS